MRWSRSLLLRSMLAALLSVSAMSQTTLVHRQRYAMGTVFEIAVYDPSPGRASAILDEALQEAVRLDRIMSNYQAESELSHLNQSSYARPQVVSPDLYQVIEVSLAYSRRSGGQFDITVAPLVNYWKSVMRGERAASESDEAKLRACVGYKNIVLTAPNLVAFRCASTQIDLGAIGKGYAVDRMVNSLRQHGINNALVNAGGSTLYGMGHPPGDAAWRVNLKVPGASQAEVLLSDNSLSTSEQSPRSLLGDRRTGHIIDPRSGEPVHTSASVSVLARTGTDSDALSTTALLLGPERTKQFLADSAGTGAVWISSTGEMKIISNTQQTWLLQTNVQDPLHRKAQK